MGFRHSSSRNYLLKLKHIRLKEKYGEGEIPHEAKTGTGPILLTCSFPYVIDWLNEHPFKNAPNARLICNIQSGSPITPEALWTVMKQLQKSIIRLLEEGSIKDVQEIGKSNIQIIISYDYGCNQFLITKEDKVEIDRIKK